MRVEREGFVNVFSYVQIRGSSELSLFFFFGAVIGIEADGFFVLFLQSRCFGHRVDIASSLLRCSRLSERTIRTSMR
jgi:hypothetical protein